MNRCCHCQHEFYSLYSICHDCYVDNISTQQTVSDTVGDKVEKLVVKVVVDWVLNNQIRIT
jgi:hypothetical protein